MKAAVITFPGSNCDRDLSMAFAAAGADVVKVEPPDPGESCRRLGLLVNGHQSVEQSLVHLYQNTGRKSLHTLPCRLRSLQIQELDFKSPQQHGYKHHFILGVVLTRAHIRSSAKRKINSLQAVERELGLFIVVSNVGLRGSKLFGA